MYTVNVRAMAEKVVSSAFSVNCWRQVKPVTVFGNGEQTRDFVYAGDIAKALLKKP